MLDGLRKIYSRDLWVSIKDMPIGNWYSISESGTYDGLFRNKNTKKNKYNNIELEDVWLDIQQQHFDEFGTDQALSERVRAMIRLNKLNLKFVQTRDRNLLNFIYIEEQNLKDETIKHFSLYEVVDSKETFKKFSIDQTKYTVLKYFYAFKKMRNVST